MLFNFNEERDRLRRMAEGLYPGDPEGQAEWIFGQGFGTAPGYASDLDPSEVRSNPGSYSGQGGQAAESPGLGRRIWCMGYLDADARARCMAGGDPLTEGENAPYVSAANIDVQSWAARGAFALVGLVMLTIGIGVVATGADPARTLRSNIKAGLEGR